MSVLLKPPLAPPIRQDYCGDYRAPTPHPLKPPRLPTFNTRRTPYAWRTFDLPMPAPRNPALTPPT